MSDPPNLDPVTVVLAGYRAWTDILPTIESINASAARSGRRCERVLIYDRAEEDLERLQGGWRALQGWTVAFTGGNYGSAATRLMGVDVSRGDPILFTDDDAVVPENWVDAMATAARATGACTGNLAAARDQSVWSRVDARIDEYRVHARDRRGAAKFMSFPNLAVSRKLLSDAGLDRARANLADDTELGARLRARGVRAQLVEDVTVRVLYPTTFRQFLVRKIRHGRGIGRLCRSLDDQVMQDLGLNSTWRLYGRWVRLSASLATAEGWQYFPGILAANLSYCTAVTLARRALPRRPPITSG